MKIRFFFILFLFLSVNIFSQEIVLEKDLSKSIYNKKTGMNHKYFGSFFFDVSAIPYQKSGTLDIIPFKSHSFQIGYRWNHRVYGIYSAGFSGSYLYEVLSMEQKMVNTFPSDALHEKEKLQKHNVALDIYNRFTFKKEYNNLGYYIDLGVYASAAPANRHKMIDKNTDPAVSGDTRVTILRNVKFIEPFNTGLFLRAGHNTFYGLIRYRIGSWIKDPYSNIQPPAWSVGAGVNL